MKFRNIIALILLAASGLGEYYVYDSLTSIDSFLKMSLGFTNAQFGLLYSFYSVANVFFFALFFAGVLVDLWGYQKSGLLFIFLCTLGAAITAFGGSPELISPSLSSWLKGAFFSDYSATFKIMAFGRMIFGIGAESLLIVIMKALVQWYGQKKVALAYACALVFYRFGAFLALNFQVKIAVRYSYQTALWIAVAVMGTSMCIYIAYLFLDHYYKPKAEINPSQEEKFRLRDIGSFPISFWSIALVCITFFGAITSFEIFDPDILKQKFGFSMEQAGFLASLLLITTMVFMPISGRMIDKKGKRASFMIYGSMIAIGALFWILFFKVPAISIIMMGLSYSLVAVSIWSSVPLVIDKRYQGTAFGILSYVQNVGLMLFPWLTGYIADMSTSKVGEKNKHDYQSVIIFFLVLMILSLIFSIFLRMKDKQSVEEGALSMEELKE